MKTIDFTQAGGFPLSQDRLGYMQTGYKEALSILARAGSVGSTPVKLWGMQYGPPVGTGSMSIVGSISDGAFFYNDELYLFSGGNYGMIVHSIVVMINTATTSLTYNDGSTHSAIIDKTATFADLPSVTDATHFPFDSMKTFGEGIYANSSPDNSFVNITTSTVSSMSGGNVDGFVYYRKMPIIESLHIIFQFSATNPTTMSSTPTRYAVANLPAAFRPPYDRYVPVCCYSEPGMNDAGTADLRFAQFYIDSTSGNCYIDMSKHTGSSYERYLFNGFVPLVG